MPSARPVLNVTLDAETKAALMAFCRAKNIPATTLGEAFARAVIAPDPPDWVDGLVEDARAIIGQRNDWRRDQPQA